MTVPNFPLAFETRLAFWARITRREREFRKEDTPAHAFCRFGRGAWLFLSLAFFLYGLATQDAHTVVRLAGTLVAFWSLYLYLIYSSSPSVRMPSVWVLSLKPLSKRDSETLSDLHSKTLECVRDSNQVALGINGDALWIARARQL